MTQETALSVLVDANPGIVLVDSEKFDRFYEEMKRETDAHVPDLTTERGRKAIASLAFKVARTKTAIDDAGKKLNEDARAKINLVDEARRKIRTQLDALRDEVRKPLSDWEDAEKARVENAENTIRHIQEIGRGMIGGEVQPFGILFRELDEKVVIDASFGEYEQIARNAKEAARDHLNEMFEQHKKAEADRLELERLRAEADAREEAERIAGEKKAQEERDRQAKADAEARAKRDAEEQQARIDAAAKAAEDAAKQAAERAERERREAQERAHADALAAEKKRADDAERARQEIDERDRKLAREQEARNADREHRGKVMAAAKTAIMDVSGISEEQAKLIVLAVVAGSVPACVITF